MSELLIRKPDGFQVGYNPITTINETNHDTGIDFGILNLKAGETHDVHVALESAYLLMHGKVTFYYDGKEYTGERASIFKQEPIAIHSAANQAFSIKALSDTELAVSQVENDQQFETLVFDETNLLESEHRGKGQLDDTAYRIVRTIFDIRNRPQAKLVLGEVITFPGRWSSYPPHHHPQPEIYHYRFSEAQGFGFGESGEDVLRIRHNDTLKILYELDHAHTTAPGYGMYYIWVIRHLDGNPYTVPDFTEQHAWTMQQEANS